MIHIREAKDFEYDKVKEFYHAVTDTLQGAQYTPGWIKGVYPSYDYLKDSIEKKELWIGILDDRIVSAMIVNHDGNESYANAEWTAKADPGQITVIHALGVRSDYSRKGIAKAMVTRVIAEAGKAGQKAVRLDVLKGNLPAERLYTGIGFRYIDTIPMYYEDTGWTDYLLYEYLL